MSLGNNSLSAALQPATPFQSCIERTVGNVFAEFDSLNGLAEWAPFRERIPTYLGLYKACHGKNPERLYGDLPIFVKADLWSRIQKSPYLHGSSQTKREMLALDLINGVDGPVEINLGSLALPLGLGGGVIGFFVGMVTAAMGIGAGIEGAFAGIVIGALALLLIGKGVCVFREYLAGREREKEAAALASRS